MRDFYRVVQNTVGRYEIRSALTESEIPYGGTSWLVKSDAEFLCSAMNQAAREGYEAGILTENRLFMSCLQAAGAAKAESRPSAQEVVRFAHEMMLLIVSEKM